MPLASILKDQQVHLWSIPLALSCKAIDSYVSLLDKNELQRANALRINSNKKKFLIKRGSLRQLLSYYLSSEPVSVRFAYAKHGKPYIEPSINPDNIRFNISDSHDMALVAITRGKEVGVDLEYDRHLDYMEELADYLLTPSENKHLHCLPAPIRNKRFLHYWTVKEAYLKYTGQGMIDLGMDRIETCFDSSASMRISRIEGRKVSPTSLSVFQPPINSYSCSVVVPGGCWEINQYRVADVFKVN